MTKYDIKQSGDGGVRVIGSVDWSPEDWDYQTSDAAVGRLLAEVKDKGAVNGFISVYRGRRDLRLRAYQVRVVQSQVHRTAQ